MRRFALLALAGAGAAYLFGSESGRKWTGMASQRFHDYFVNRGGVEAIVKDRLHEESAPDTVVAEAFREAVGEGEPAPV